MDPEVPPSVGSEATIRRSIGYLAWLAIEEAGGMETIVRATYEALRLSERFLAPAEWVAELKAIDVREDPSDTRAAISEGDVSNSIGARANILDQLDVARAAHDEVLRVRAGQVVEGLIAGHLGAYSSLCGLATMHRACFPAKFPTELTKCGLRAALSCCPDHIDHERVRNGPVR